MDTMEPWVNEQVASAGVQKDRDGQQDHALTISSLPLTLNQRTPTKTENTKPNPPSRPSCRAGGHARCDGSC